LPKGISIKQLARLALLVISLFEGYILKSADFVFTQHKMIDTVLENYLFDLSINITPNGGA